MTTLYFQDFVTILLGLAAGFVFLHIICTAISNRILEREEWRPRHLEDETTEDTGPK